MLNFFSRLPAILFVLSVAVMLWGYGVLSQRYDLFPAPEMRAMIVKSIAAAKELAGQAGVTLPRWYRERAGQVENVVAYDPTAIGPGLTLIVGIGPDSDNIAKIVDSGGHVIHQWTVGWFTLWPNPTHLPEEAVPKAKPGEIIHGVALTDNGDLVFNYERLGMVRIDACSSVKWRLAERTHHSLYWDTARRSFWTLGQRSGASDVARLPNHAKSFVEYSILEVSPEGKILQEISIADMLIRNGLQGMLYMSTKDNWGTAVSGDTLHANDVETFPEKMTPGIFQPGDVMVSLRNINGVFVFDGKTLKTKFKTIGKVLRQHDPDFVDGNTISIFDNNNLRPETKDVYSKIAQIDARDGSASVVYGGSAEQSFFTDIMGKHQYLDNGNILLTESRNGRALEVTEDGRVVWEYNNVVEPGVVGLLSEAQRLPARFDKAFFAEKEAACAR
jgi:hypothetical protein